MFINGKNTVYDFMEGGHNSLDIFTKIEKVKIVLSPVISGMTDKEVQAMLCHCWHYKLERKKDLTPQEHELFDLLLKNGLSSKTIYHWFCLNVAPDHIKQKIRERKISVVDAISQSNAWRKLKTQRGSVRLMEDIREVIGGLTWKSQEPTQD